MPNATTSSRPRCHVRKGDTVMVISGQNRGKTGTVIKVWPVDQRVLVDCDAAFYHTHHVKPDPQRRIEGGRVQRLRPIHISNVQLLDPTTSKPCRVRRERVDGKLVRVSKRSGHRFEAK